MRNRDSYSGAIITFIWIHFDKYLFTSHLSRHILAYKQQAIESSLFGSLYNYHFTIYFTSWFEFILIVKYKIKILQQKALLTSFLEFVGDITLSELCSILFLVVEILSKLK